MKLTPKQQMVIKLLQKGEQLITAAANGDEKAYAGVTDGKKIIKLSLRVFWNLEYKGLIFQNASEHHSFTLTKAGREF